LAKTVDSQTMTLQYLEALNVVGSAPSTKFVLPMDLADVVTGLAGGKKS